MEASTKKDGKKHGVIRASAFFENCDALPGKLLTLDCKVVGATQSVFARALLAFIRKYDLGKCCKIESTLPSFIDIIESSDPALELIYTARTHL